ncbi:hypothetical protein Nepgr_000801 [Nepenthes gracilis]|uniref:Protein kinase domain-containing protein n=1 Tax=Nepenthes gracilis TaxID=150966 RepID=A0AAD3P4B2_NEPGR|nr:hypothetical protein Nepgr_000801 [Nepenthes gracilis]
MKNKVLLFVLHNQLNWVLQFFRVDATRLSHLSSISGPEYSPLSSPVCSPMSAFSPGIIEANEDPKMNRHKNLVLALIVASASVGVLIFSLLFLWIYHKNISDKHRKNNAKRSDGIKRFARRQVKGNFDSLKMNLKWGSVSTIDYKLLESATGNFEKSNILGKGGFGCVYKARLDDNHYVAVKKVDGGGQDAEREFENEVDLLSVIHHPNIIALLGYCIHEETRYLICELMENGSLETQLHGPSRGSALTWHIRMKIALDVARGLQYLHEHCNPLVIHRDLKSSNILLDADFNAKLSDFGLAVSDRVQNKNIKLSGTLGYVAPEYLLDGKLTDKTDVYAFGVVLLELLLGRKPVEKLSPSQCQSIVTWAMPQLTDRLKLPNIIDPAIRDTMDTKHLYQVAAVAVLCVQPEPSYRPLITDVLHSLIPLVPVELGGTLRVSQRAVLVPSSL